MAEPRESAISIGGQVLNSCGFYVFDVIQSVRVDVDEGTSVMLLDVTPIESEREVVCADDLRS